MTMKDILRSKDRSSIGKMYRMAESCDKIRRQQLNRWIHVWGIY